MGAFPLLRCVCGPELPPCVGFCLLFPHCNFKCHCSKDSTFPVIIYSWRAWRAKASLAEVNVELRLEGESTPWCSVGGAFKAEMLYQAEIDDLFHSVSSMNFVNERFVKHACSQTAGRKGSLAHKTCLKTGSAMKDNSTFLEDCGEIWGWGGPWGFIASEGVLVLLLVRLLFGVVWLRGVQ